MLHWHVGCSICAFSSNKHHDLLGYKLSRILSYLRTDDECLKCDDD